MEDQQSAGVASAAGRGAALFGASGAVLGGVAGSAVWPGVGSCFGAVEGAFAGALVGVLDGAVVNQVGRWVKSVWALRAVSGILGGAAAVLGAVCYRGPISASAALATGLVTAAVVASAFLGPLMRAVAPVPDAVVPRLGRFVVRGLAVGAALGAVAGLLVGWHVHPATAPFAAVEGGFLGAPNGAALACAAAGIQSLTRLRFRH